MSRLRIHPIVKAGLCAASICPGLLAAQSVTELDLWTDQIPFARQLTAPEKADKDGHLSNIETPSLTVYLPSKDQKPIPAVVICPGGGYCVLSFEKEGREIARWLNTLGIAGVVLKNRVLPYLHPVPLLDGQRSIRMVRHHASSWGIDTRNIGIMGFSAGGHLASSVGTHFDDGDPNAPDPIQRQSCRPDFMILVYPVISMQGEFAHAGSRTNLLGGNPSAELMERMSSERQVTERTPPAFLVHSSDDTSVPSENSVLFYLALKKAGVPAEMHIYLRGGHGYGLRREMAFAAGDWPGRCEAWLRAQGILAAE